MGVDITDHHGNKSCCIKASRGFEQVIIGLKHFVEHHLTLDTHEDEITAVILQNRSPQYIVYLRKPLKSTTQVYIAITHTPK